MTNNKNKMMIEDAEYGVDSRYKSNKERESDAAALMETRLKRMKGLTKDQIIRAKLLQLKLKMEDYLKKPVYDKRNYFSEPPKPRLCRRLIIYVRSVSVILLKTVLGIIAPTLQ